MSIVYYRMPVKLKEYKYIYIYIFFFYKDDYKINYDLWYWMLGCEKNNIFIKKSVAKGEC